jgi:hypothetical protein
MYTYMYTCIYINICSYLGAIKVIKNSFNAESIITNPIRAVEFLANLKNISIESTVSVNYDNPVIIGDKKR